MTNKIIEGNKSQKFPSIKYQPLFFPLRKFSFSLKRIEQSLPKIYTVDNAFIEQIAENNMGKKLENLVFVSLLRRGFVLNRDVFYFRLNNGEVDFVVRFHPSVETPAPAK